MLGIQVPNPDPVLSLAQYGVLGIFTLCALTAVIVLFRREAKALDLERESNKKLLAEISSLNADIRDKYITTLGAATAAIGEALAIMRKVP